jgi:hypothetical protein
MPPLRAQMTQDMPLQQLAPKTQTALSLPLQALPSSRAVHPPNCARTRAGRISTLYESNATSRGVPVTRSPVG